MEKRVGDFKKNKKATRALTSVMDINFCPKSKRSQVTIFVIIAIMIIVVGILIYMFYPKIKTDTSPELKNPQAFIQTCIEDEIKNSVEKLSLQGGSSEPTNYVVYENEKIDYVCFTEEFYKTCTMQQPLLKKHIESEIETGIKEKVNECFDDLKTSYEEENYEVDLGRGEIDVELLPKRISATFNYSLTLTKDSTEKFKSFKVVLNNNLYELVSIANSILKWEALYGDADITIYMDLYRDLKVEKILKTDGTAIYILTDRNNQNKFQFASRSLIWPSGYGFY